MTEQAIPAQAVEAAAKALWAKRGESVLDESHYREARTVLESATPHMLRTVWDEAYGRGWDAARGEPDTPNPYDEEPK